MVLSFIMYYFVFMENSFAASSIRTFDSQHVISTGPYAVVRHPKYIGDILLILVCLWHWAPGGVSPFLC